METADVVIIGGGIIGLATAYHLVALGCRHVAVLEKEDAPVTGSTARSAGGIRLQFSTEVNIRLSRHSLEELKRFPARFGVDPGLRQHGYLFLLSDPADMAAFQTAVQLQRRLGVPVEWLAPGALAERFPWVNPAGLLAATFCPEDGYADPYTVAMAYGKQAVALGARLHVSRPATAVLREGARVTGVRTPAGDIAAPVVVNAAGPYAGYVGRLAGVPIPVEPYRRQVFVTEPFAQLPAELPLTLDFSPAAYLRREGDRILFGMSDRDEPPGFHLTTDDEFMVRAAAAVAHRVPALAEARVARGWAGLYEITPDANAIIGAAPELAGFYMAVGFSGHGFQHGPAVGRVLAEMILGLPPTVDVSMLALDRFREDQFTREHGVV